MHARLTDQEKHDGREGADKHASLRFLWDEGVTEAPDTPGRWQQLCIQFRPARGLPAASNTARCSTRRKRGLPPGDSGCGEISTRHACHEFGAPPDVSNRGT